jgi:hypothetical protein
MRVSRADPPARADRTPRPPIPAALASEPREKPPVTRSAIVSRSGSVTRRAVCTARQSLGTTSQPAPESTMTPARRAASSIDSAKAKVGYSAVVSR